MAKLACIQATSCGDALRRTIEVREKRGRRRRIAVVAAFAVVPCAAIIALRPPPLLLWNASASTPRGLYRVFPGGEVHRGDSVIAVLREPYRTLAARRGYLPRGVPLVKQVAAMPGDRICARGSRISIDGEAAVVRKTLDADGRELPRWSGCNALRAGEYLLLGESPWSFDGRYVGPTKASEIIGRAVLLWRA
jgi:conjugative transfer signal peptidase TraF